jgi:hypothetical protein
MDKNEISQRIKDTIVYTFKNPFDAGVAVSFYVIGAAAGICCVLAALGLSYSMVVPFFQGVGL